MRRELEQAVLEAARRWARGGASRLQNAVLELAVLDLERFERSEGPAPSAETTMLRCPETVGRILEAVREFRTARTALATLRKELEVRHELEDLARVHEQDPDAKILVAKIAAATATLMAEDNLLEGLEEAHACAAVERALEGGL